MEADDLPIEKVCRTCLGTSTESCEALFKEDESELNIIQMLKQTFGNIILHPSSDLPQSICLECQDIVQKAYHFKLGVHKSTNVLLGKQEQEIVALVEECGTQTDPPTTQVIRKSKPTEVLRSDVMQFDDENFDSINLQSEDCIFDANPLLEINSTASNSVKVKTEDTGLTDEEYDSSTGNVDGDLNNTDEPGLMMIKSEESFKMICDVYPFNGGDDGEDKGDSKYKIHKCDHCNKCFSRATHLKRHQLTHEEGKIVCSICDKRFTRIDHLNLHVASNHSESKPYQCGIAECKKGFVRQEHLKKHIEAKHNEASKDKEICEICQKAFSSKKYLRTHMKSHSGETKGLSCKYCSKEFLEKSELNDHMTKEHQNEKPYLCSECGLRFVRNDYLVIHMRRHMGVKPYKCRFCEKGFPRATDLTVHERYHTNEKTHLCNLCGKGFQRAYNLLVHMRVHTGEKPYQCSFCNKSFSQGNDLKAHIRRHTGERFKCDLCSEGFIQGYHLTHHKRTVHGLDVKSHIRRVEKFVAPSTLNQQLEEEKFVEETDEIKMEDQVGFST